MSRIHFVLLLVVSLAALPSALAARDVSQSAVTSDWPMFDLGYEHRWSSESQLPDWSVWRGSLYWYTAIDQWDSGTGWRYGLSGSYERGAQSPAFMDPTRETLVGTLSWGYWDWTDVAPLLLARDINLDVRPHLYATGLLGYAGSHDSNELVGKGAIGDAGAMRVGLLAHGGWDWFQAETGVAVDYSSTSSGGQRSEIWLKVGAKCDFGTAYLGYLNTASQAATAGYITLGIEIPIGKLVKLAVEDGFRS